MKEFLLMSLMMICQLHMAKDIEVQVESYSYTNDSTSAQITLVEYRIKNQSNEPYFTWIDFDNHKGKSEKRIHRYFFAPHNDFNLATLMTDNVVQDSSETILGRTFIKRLEPQESFKYIVVCREKNDDFSKYIVVEKTSFVSKIIGFNVPEVFLYGKSELVVL